MRKEYDFSNAIPLKEWRRLRKHRRVVEVSVSSDPDVAPLTRARIRELDRRVKDAKDRTRYLLATSMGPRFALYYDVSDDCYTMNDPTRATLFKRRAAAQAIGRQLGQAVKIVRCRVDAKGRLVLRSLPKTLATSPRRRKGVV